MQIVINIVKLFFKYEKIYDNIFSECPQKIARKNEKDSLNTSKPKHCSHSIFIGA